MARHGLSKSRFVAGWQCHRQLWWRVFEPEAQELIPDASLQSVFDRGSAVGEIARDYVPGGVLIDFPHDQIDRKLQATAAAINSNAQVIYEASFIGAGVFAAVDVLERNGDGWNLIEVKSTTQAKPEHVPDVAVQMFALESAGLKIIRSELMHLNRECRYPDLSNLFARTDLTVEARNLQTAVQKEVADQLLMLQGGIPSVEPGPFCTEPRDCPFLHRCWPKLPEHHISSLYRIGQKSVGLEAQGIHTIFDLPQDYPLSAVASRQRISVQENKVVVEQGLKSALEKWKAPIAFLDFETIAPAIPVWNGCRPYDPVPVQFSCHTLDLDGSLKHLDWIADGPFDPRENLVAHVAEAVKGATVILAWNASFERRCLNDVKACLPHLAEQIEAIVERIDDLLPVVRNHVYHPHFDGSFSIKSVLPALLPDLGYDGMAIADGQSASDTLEAMLLRGNNIPIDTKNELLENLRAYCRLDTYAMVALLAKLREIA